MNSLSGRLRSNPRLFADNSNTREQRLKTIGVKDISKKYPHRVLLLLDDVPAPLEKQIEFSWNPEDCSSNMSIKEDKLTAYRIQKMNCTDGIRGKTAISEGLHIWEVCWPISKRGTNATIGVGTAAASLHSSLYMNLVGQTKDSWGWDIVDCKLFHNAQINSQGHTYPVFDETKATYQVPSTFFLVLDMDAGTLSFIADGVFLGVAFDGLQGQVLYPFVGCVWGSCEITLKYIGSLNQENCTLKELCRRYIRETIGRDKIETKVSEMEIPNELKMHLLYKDPLSTYNLRVLNADKENN